MEFHPGHAWVTQRTMQSPPLNPSSELLTSFMQTCGGCFFGHFYVCLFSYYNWKLEAGAQNVPSWWDQYCAFQGLFICGHFFWIVRLDDVLIFFFFSVSEPVSHPALFTWPHSLYFSSHKHKTHAGGEVLPHPSSVLRSLPGTMVMETWKIKHLLFNLFCEKVELIETFSWIREHTSLCIRILSNNDNTSPVI